MNDPIMPVFNKTPTVTLHKKDLESLTRLQLKTINRWAIEILCERKKALKNKKG